MIARIVTSIRRNAIAWLALFVALTGTSMAASHYVVSSTKQIKPSVMKKLRGNRGPAGAQGPAGPQGSQGKEGVGSQGVRGPTGATGATGTKGSNGATGRKRRNGRRRRDGSDRGSRSDRRPRAPPAPPAPPVARVPRAKPARAARKRGRTSAANGVVTKATASAQSMVSADPINKGTKKAEPGMYCITGLPFQPENVTVDAGLARRSQLRHAGARAHRPHQRIGLPQRSVENDHGRNLRTGTRRRHESGRRRTRSKNPPTRASSSSSTRSS